MKLEIPLTGSLDPPSNKPMERKRNKERGNNLSKSVDWLVDQ